MSRKSIRLFLFALAASAFVLPSSAIAKKSKTKKFEAYVIEFACGHTGSDLEGLGGIEYGTSITVTNIREEATTVRARAQITQPEAIDSDRVRQELPAGQARSFDCDDFLGGLFAMDDRNEDLPDFVQGILIVESRDPIHVVVRNTAAGSDDQVAIDIREISGTTVKRRVRDIDEEEDSAVDICHAPPGNPSNRHTITVGAGAVAAHLRHGDDEGACDD